MTNTETYWTAQEIRNLLEPFIDAKFARGADGRLLPELETVDIVCDRVRTPNADIRGIDDRGIETFWDSSTRILPWDKITFVAIRPVDEDGFARLSGGREFRFMAAAPAMRDAA